MTHQPRDFQTVLTERIALIQAIAAANCEHMRLNQIASGLMILDQMDEGDGAAFDARAAERATNVDAVSACTILIATLESQLAELDRELAAAMERKTK